MRWRGVALTLIPLLWAALVAVWCVPLDRFPQDSYYYLLLAESLSRGDGYTIQGEPHDLYVAGYPLHLVLLALLSLSPVAAAKVLALAFGAATIYLTLRFGKVLIGEVEGLAAGVVLASWPMFGRWCMAPMAEPVFGFYALLALALAWKGAREKKPTLVAAAFLVGGIAPVVRYTGMLLGPPLVVMVLAMWPRDPTRSSSRPAIYRLLGLATILFCLPFLAWGIRNWIALGSPLQTGYLRYVHDPNQTTLTYYWNQVTFSYVRFPLSDLATRSIPLWFQGFRIGFVVVYWLGVVSGTWVAIRRHRWELASLSLWVVLLHLFHVVWPFREERFFMPGFPAVSLLGCYALSAVIRRHGPALDADLTVLPPAESVPHRQGHSEARRARLFIGLTALLAAVLISFSPTVYGMQFLGLRWQSSVSQAEAAGREIQKSGTRWDRVASFLDVAEMYYYARRPVERFRTVQDLQNILRQSGRSPRLRLDQRLWVVVPEYGAPPEFEQALEDLQTLPNFESLRRLDTDRPMGVYLASFRR